MVHFDFEQDTHLSAFDNSDTDKPLFYLTGLNTAQHQAVCDLDNPLLVLAGAGTGKTRVLTSRIAHIIHSNRAKPWQILAVTFTNKAAKEMQERVAGLLGENQSLSWAGTFHSVAAKILRFHAACVGLNSNFTILNDDDQERLLKQILESAGEDLKRTPAKILLSVIDRWKNRGLTPDKISVTDIPDIYSGRAAEYYEIYQDRLKTLNAVDFGDLLLHNITIFQKHPNILADFHAKFKYILVDEYQDTNIAQYLWLRLLASGQGNICCVGDDDQSIYGWRGAEVGNILKFERDFDGANIIRLEENYRSTPTILRAASCVIANNTGRLGKTLFSHNADGDKITLKILWNGDEEAVFIVQTIEEIAYKHEISLSEIAILVRTSAQMRVIEERMILSAVPYRVVGGLKFYERAEIRDALAYVRLVSQPHDDLAFERIINKPKRGLGDAAVNALRDMARFNNESIYMAAHKMIQTGAFKPKPKQALTLFMQNLENWIKLSQTMSVSELTATILDESGYMDMLKQDISPESAGRTENIKELVKSVDGYESLGQFLEHVALVMDNNAPDVQEKVTIMTLHAAKGLEFHTVFLPGWEDGLFPSQKSMDENGLAGLEEERRLAYVALTRAKMRIFLSFAQNRRLYNQWQTTVPSRFIDEIPDDVIVSQRNYFQKPKNDLSYFDSHNSNYDTAGWQRAKENYIDHQDDAMRPVVQKKSNVTYKKGDKITHQKFGTGIIISVETDNLLIQFEGAGFKNVKADFVNIV